MGDRVLAVSFSISLGIHLLLLIGQLLSINWLAPWQAKSALEVVYEYEMAQREVRRLQERLSRVKREATSAPSTEALREQVRVQIPDRPSLAADQSIAQVLPGRSAVVDLTNLVDAARGDPVLLSYFSALREQIQQAANQRAWLSGETDQGLVYVSFVLSARGDIQGLGVVAERSVASDVLRQIALRIVKVAAPFPPFPPSMTEPSKTIVVPLEFLLGS